MTLNSIRARMTLAFAGSIALLMACVCGSMVWYARHAAASRADTLLQAMARKIVADQKHDPNHDNYTDLIEDTQDDLQPNGMALLVANAQGHIIAQSQRRVPLWPRTRDDGWRITTLPLGTDTVVIGMPWHRTELDLRGQAVALSFLGLVVVLMAGVGAWLLVGRTLSPIGSLSRQAQAASVESLHVNLNAPSHDAEIVGLVTTLNGLLARLAATAEAKGRFHAAASHELRTPLQALSGHLELALSRERTAPEYRSLLEEAHKQTRRLISLTQDLLLLNQIGSAPLPPGEPVNLPDLCERALSAFAPTIAAQKLRVKTEIPSKMMILAAPTHAEMLVRNLIENAVKYADSGGQVHVRLSNAPGGARLDIFNDCTLPPVWDTEKLFEPFYRPDASRNSKTGGTGLGLAICKAIADANGWSLTLHPEAGGVRAVVLFKSKS